LAIEAVDCGIHVGVIGHLHEAEAAGTAGLAIRDYFGSGHIAKLVKQRL
jgi:hypothetical protein